MQRTTITLDDDLMDRLDEFMKERQYANRSEAIRDLVRAGLEQSSLDASPAAQCLGGGDLRVRPRGARSVAAGSRARRTSITTCRSRRCTCTWTTTAAWK